MEKNIGAAGFVEDKRGRGVFLFQNMEIVSIRIRGVKV